MVDRLLVAGWKTEDVEELFGGNNPERVLQLIRGEATLARVRPETTVVAISDRAQALAEAKSRLGVIAFCFEDLQALGPPSFDVFQLQVWRHPSQVKPRDRQMITGEEIIRHLLGKGLLSRSLGLEDLQAILSNREAVRALARRFPDPSHTPMGWRSVVDMRRNGCGGNREVPCIVFGRRSSKIAWHWTGNVFDGDYPTLMFPPDTPVAA